MGGQPPQRSVARERRRRAGAVALLVAAVSMSGTPEARAAGESILDVAISPTLGCAFDHRDDPLLQFFGTGGGAGTDTALDPETAACGTFLGVGGRVHGPADDSYQPGDDPVPFKPLTQNRSGSGTSADPFRVETRVEAKGTGIWLRQVDTWTSASEDVATRIDVHNTTERSQSVLLYRAGDCQVGTFAAVPMASRGRAACVAATQDGARRDIGRLVAGDAIVRMTGNLATGEAGPDLGFGWSWFDELRAPVPLRGSCPSCLSRPGDVQLGLSWRLVIDPGSSLTVRTVTTISTGSARALPRLDAAVAADDAGAVDIVLGDAPAAWVAGRTVRVLRDGTEVCRARTDRAGRARCSTAPDLGTADPEVARLTAGREVEVMFDGSLDLRPASAVVTVADPPAAVGNADLGPCAVRGWVTASGSAPGSSNTYFNAATSCTTVRYALLDPAGDVLAYVPGDEDGAAVLEYANFPNAWRWTVSRFADPDVVLQEGLLTAVSPGKIRG